MSAPLPIATDVVHETIDGEVIVINLATGTYFNLQAGGAEWWALHVTGAPLPEAASELAARHGADPAAVLAELTRLAGDLHHHGVLAAAPEPAPAGPAEAGLGSLEVPPLGVFTDMEEFLLVDPIHEVDVSGWPNTPAGTG